MLATRFAAEYEENTDVIQHKSEISFSSNTVRHQSTLCKDEIH